MPIAFLDLVISLVSHPRIDHGFGNIPSCAIRAKGMTQDMPTANHVPFAAVQCSLEMVMGLVPRQFFIALKAEAKRSARMPRFKP